MDTPPGERRRPPAKVRLIIAANALLFVAVSGAYVFTPLPDALKAVALEETFSRIVTVIYFALTLAAAVIWLAEVARRARGIDKMGRTTAAIAIDGAILALWSMFLVGLCLYGFMLGMGG
jgi:hypothetical protein